MYRDELRGIVYDRLFESENRQKLEIRQDQTNDSEYYNFKVLELVASWDGKNGQK